MRVLGIDSGSRVTGYGVIDGDGADCVYVSCGVIRVSPSEPLSDRLHTIYRGIMEVISKLQPDVAAFEGIFHAHNVQSALKLGHVRGVCMAAVAEAKLPVHEYSPLEVKCAVTGFGRAEKPQVQQMVCALLKLKARPEAYDASDALAVAICHAHSSRMKQAVAGQR
jgi:crossover junction endodeoxyribonuclease RuvC